MAAKHFNNKIFLKKPRGFEPKILQFMKKPLTD